MVHHIPNIFLDLVADGHQVVQHRRRSISQLLVNLISQIGVNPNFLDLVILHRSAAYQILQNNEVVAWLQRHVNQLDVMHDHCRDKFVLLDMHNAVLDSVAFQLTRVIVDPGHLTQIPGLMLSI